MDTLTCSPASKSVTMTTKEIPSADEDRVIWLKTQRLNDNSTCLLFFILSANDLTWMTELCPTLYNFTILNLYFNGIFAVFLYKWGRWIELYESDFWKKSVYWGEKNIKRTKVPLQPFRVMPIDPPLQLFTGCLCHSFITGPGIPNQSWKVQRFKDLPPVTVTTVCLIRSSWTLKHEHRTGQTIEASQGPKTTVGSILKSNARFDDLNINSKCRQVSGALGTFSGLPESKFRPKTVSLPMATGTIQAGMCHYSYQPLLIIIDLI